MNLFKWQNELVRNRQSQLDFSFFADKFSLMQFQMSAVLAKK